MLALRQILRPMRIVLAAAARLAPLSARLRRPRRRASWKRSYSVTLAGIPIGKGSWTIEIGDTHYSASATGATTGLMRVLTEGEGSTTAHGTLGGGKVLSATYVPTIKSRKQKDEVHVTLDKGNVKDTRSIRRPTTSASAFRSPNPTCITCSTR